MRRLFLISSYCDNEKKLNVLNHNIEIIKKNGWDVLLMSPLEIPTDIVKNVDLFIRTKENPVTPITEKCYIHWKTIFIDGFEYKLERFFPDYGWADLYQRKKLSEIALLYNYDVFYHVIYDTKFDDNLINEIKNNITNCYYSNKSTNGFINECSLHFLPLTRDMLLDFKYFIDKDSYVTTSDLTDHYILKWIKKNNLKKSNLIVNEEINFFNEINFFSQSKSNNFDLFMGKDETNTIKNKFIFYNVKTNLNIIFNENIEHSINTDGIIDTNLYSDSIYSILINGESYIDEFNKLERNLIVKI